jgi:hypothetical protein
MECIQAKRFSADVYGGIRASGLECKPEWEARLGGFEEGSGIHLLYICIMCSHLSEPCNMFGLATSTFSQFPPSMDRKLRN